MSSYDDLKAKFDKLAKEKQESKDKEETVEYLIPTAPELLAFSDLAEQLGFHYLARYMRGEVIPDEAFLNHLRTGNAFGLDTSRLFSGWRDEGSYASPMPARHTLENSVPVGEILPSPLPDYTEFMTEDEYRQALDARIMEWWGTSTDGTRERKD